MTGSDPSLPRRALDGLRTPVAVTDGDGVLVFVNRAWQGIAGELGAGLGSGFQDRDARQGIREVIEGRRPGFTWGVAGGGRFSRLTATPLEGRGGCLVQPEDDATDDEDLFRRAFASNPDPSTLSSYPDGRIVEANPAWCALTGVSRERALGRTPADLGLWTDPLDRSAILKEVAQTGAFPGRQVEMRLPSGEIRQMLLAASALDTPQGLRILLTGRDVTERHRALIALRENEARFLALFELSPDGISVSRIRDRTFLQVNAAWEAMFGYTRQEALGRTVEDLGLFVDPPDAGDLPWDLPEAGAAPARTFTLARKDGARLEAEVKGMVLDIQGEPCLLASLRDVTREAALKRTLLATEERFRVITGGLKDYILILDPGGCITYINRTPEGIQPSEALGRPFPVGLAPETQAAGAAALRTCLETRQGVSYGAQGLRLDGTRGWFDVRLEPFPAEGEVQCVVVLALDRSDARQAEEAERRAQKAESLVLMAGSIAHDFNNLFAAIQASLEILEIQVRDQEGPVLTVATAREVLRRAIALSWKMNEFSGHAVTRRVPTDLVELVSAWAGAQEPPQGRRLALDLGAVPPILADPDRLRIILDALLENAWEAMDEDGRGGTVALRTFVDSGEETLPGPWAAPRPPGAATVCLEVANDGPCPDPEVLARMFDPFFTTRFVGRGLGLASVLGLLKTHGAGIQVVPGQGLAFRMHFPLRTP